MESTSALIVIFTAVLGFWIYFLRNKSKYPPGPTGLPYFGSFFSTGPGIHAAFSKWAKIYGPVFNVKLGGVRAVVLNDTKSIREAFKLDTFAGRPANKLFMQLANGGKNGWEIIFWGIGFSDGQIWTEQRRFALRGLRDLGFGTKSMESIVMDEVNDFVGWLKEETGHPISLNRKFTLAILNSLWMLTCGHRFKQDDPELTKALTTVAESLSKAVNSGYAVFMPELSSIAPELTGWNQFVTANRKINTILKAEILEQDQSFVPSNPPRHFIDMYLANIKSTVDPNSSFYKEEGYFQLESVLRDFFGAGSQTTSATLTWAVLYLATNPNAQKKLQEEIDQVVGWSRHPILADKSQLPYTEAVMNEVLRCSSIVPTALFHSTMKNVSFQGFEIPKDTYIIANIHGVHHDPEIWNEPQKFWPERFLSEDRKTVIKSDNMLPFSSGKRVCMGESLARDEFFLFLTNIFQRFEVRTDRPIEDISLEPVLGFILQPKLFYVILKDRLQ